VRQYCGTAGGLAGNGDVVRVAAELFDVERTQRKAASWPISPSLPDDPSVDASAGCDKKPRAPSR
jgi:hypothetical protein